MRRCSDVEVRRDCCHCFTSSRPGLLTLSASSRFVAQSKPDKSPPEAPSSGDSGKEASLRLVKDTACARPGLVFKILLLGATLARALSWSERRLAPTSEFSVEAPVLPLGAALATSSDNPNPTVVCVARQDPVHGTARLERAEARPALFLGDVVCQGLTLIPIPAIGAVARQAPVRLQALLERAQAG
jgi:hypothetical protein